MVFLTNSYFREIPPYDALESYKIWTDRQIFCNAAILEQFSLFWNIFHQAFFEYFICFLIISSTQIFTHFYIYMKKIVKKVKKKMLKNGLRSSYDIIKINFYKSLENYLKIT